MQSRIAYPFPGPAWGYPSGGPRNIEEARARSGGNGRCWRTDRPMHAGAIVRVRHRGGWVRGQGSEAGRGVGAAGEAPTVGVVVEPRTDADSTSRLALWSLPERAGVPLGRGGRAAGALRALDRRGRAVRPTFEPRRPSRHRRRHRAVVASGSSRAATGDRYIDRRLRMFVQVIQGQVSDAGQARAALDRWVQELAPGATGWLGSTAGVTEDGRFIARSTDWRPSLGWPRWTAGRPRRR
jgi:hypothetical protein